MLRVLILVSLLVVICSCESMFNEINNSEQLWSSELGLERGSCISCLPSVSEKTLEKNQLTFNIDHISLLIIFKVQKLSIFLSVDL